MAFTVEMRTQVAQLYTALFGRAPDFEGLSFWTTQLSNGASLVQVADQMYNTAPARAYYPVFLANREIVASFYLNVLGRIADASGLAFWTAQLDAQGATPGSVIVKMIANVATYAGIDPAGLFSQQLFNNKVTVAQHYGETGGSIAGATTILGGVTADPATVTSAINAIDGVDLDKPVFGSAAVTGATLVMTYADANALDSAHGPAASAFAVMVDGVSRAVTAVAVDANAKTVTLTLASAVGAGQAVTVAYTDPTSGNDANATQDASGNDAASLSATAATNNTPAGADVTAPVFNSASVDGVTLVMNYTDLNLLDAAHLPAASAFSVMVGGVARTVSAVAIDASLKTVTLTLASAVTSGQVVTVAYTDPTSGNDANAIQDATGNDAVTLAATAATNVTAGTDTVAPVFASASVNGANLEMTYTELNYMDPHNLPATTAFTVMVAGVARAVSSVSIHAIDKIVTLALASPVLSGQTVTVAYTDPTSGNDANAIQDLDGNDAATITAKAVTNITPDVTAPVFASATVNGASLVMTYTELNLLDATHEPAAGAFSVLVDSVARTVSSVAVDANAKTVTLTLASAVANGQTVTVAYTDPTSGDDANAIQDATGNDAVTLAATAVTNITGDTTAPVFASASVNGASLVMTYTELNLLDAAHAPAAGAFSVLVDSVARTVNSVVVDANAKTVTLMLASPVTSAQTVTVAYTDPTAGNDTNAIQDASGNDAATLAATAVTNSTPADVTAPVFVSASVNGTSLVMTYTEAILLDAANAPAAGAFSVLVESVARTVNSVVVDANAKTVTLTLASAVLNGETVTVAYTDPTGGNDANAIQDNSGNDAATLGATAVTNNTPDTTAPVFASAAVDGASLVMTYTELNLLDAANAPAAGTFSVLVDSVARTVNSVAVDANAKTVTLTLASAVLQGQAVTVAYADPTGGNDANAIQDATGNDAASLGATAVTNNTPDATAPVFASATVDGSSLVMTYTEANLLDAANVPAAGTFSVLVDSVARAVNSVVVDANAKTVTLTLASAVLQGETVTVAYSDPTGGDDANAIQDATGNDAASLGATAVTNNTPDTTAPVFASAAVDGASLVMTYTEANLLDAVNAPAPGDFSVLVESVARAVNSVVVDANAKTVTLTLASAVANGEAVTVAYTDPTGGNDASAIQDATGNDAASLGATAVTNNTADTTAPVFANAHVNGGSLVMTFTELNLLDAVNAPGTGAFAVTVDAVGDAVNSVLVDANAKTVTLTLATAVTNGQTVTVDYTDPTGGNDVNAIQDASGNDAISLVGVSVTNDTP